MTKLGKIYTGIMLVLSIFLFLAGLMANATHTDYGAVLNAPETGLKAVAQRNQARVSELTGLIQKQKDAIAIEMASRRGALAALQKQVAELNLQVRTLEKDLTQKLSEVYTIASTEKTSQEDLTVAGKLNDDTKAELAAAVSERNALFVKFRDTYGALLKLKGDQKTLEAQLSQFEAQGDSASPSDVGVQ